MLCNLIDLLLNKISDQQTYNVLNPGNSCETNFDNFLGKIDDKNITSRKDNANDMKIERNNNNK